MAHQEEEEDVDVATEEIDDNGTNVGPNHNSETIRKKDSSVSVHQAPTKKHDVACSSMNLPAFQENPNNFNTSNKKQDSNNADLQNASMVMTNS